MGGVSGWGAGDCGLHEGGVEEAECADCSQELWHQVAIATAHTVDMKDKKETLQVLKKKETKQPWPKGGLHKP